MPPDPDRLDYKDRRIVEAIAQNRQASIPLISQIANIPQSTVSKRLAELIRTNRIGRVLEIFDWPAAGYFRRYRIDILVDQRALGRGEGGHHKEERIDTQEKLGEYIKYRLSQKYIGRVVVVDVGILLGHAADLTVIVYAKGRNAIRDFITNGIRRCGGVESSSTSEEIWTCPPLPELAAAAEQFGDQTEV